MRVYGADPAASSSPDLLALAQQYAPIAQSLVLPTDAVERAGVIEARIANYRRMRVKLPLLATFYNNEIRKLEAQLAASKRATSLQIEQEGSRRIFRYLGWGAAGVGILVGAALVVRLLRKK